MNLKIIPKRINNYFKTDNTLTIKDYVVSNSESGPVNHFYSKEFKGYIFILLGTLYETGAQKKPIDYVIEKYFSGDSLYELDGSFILVVFLPDSSIQVYSERSGLIPLYYRIDQNEIIISTESSDLFYDYSYVDIDFSSVYDFLRYGMLIGNNTMSKKVKLLQGGSLLAFSGEKISITRLFRFIHDSSNQINDEELLLDEIDKAYTAAFLKRIDRPESEIAVLLSGGMDSRLILAYANKCCTEKIKAYSFGQDNSEEVDVAKKVAEIEGNMLETIKLMPKDFVDNSVEYLRLVGGSDFFPQSYILEAAKTIASRKISAFMTGSFIECYMGGTFLLSDALNYNGLFSDYVITHVDKIKCGLFKEEELSQMISNHSLFEGKMNNLYKEASGWDAFSVKDAIQAFITDMRDKRLVLNREITPAIYLDYINPNFDKDLLDVISRIPPEQRMARNFYRKLFVKKFPKYANVVYNNTTLPISFDLELWKEGTRIEYEREKIYASQQKKGTLVFYPHFYSDFEGYSKYDVYWQILINETLINSKCIISNFLNIEYIRDLVNKHFSGEKSYRKQIVCLVSLELFFKYYFKNGGVIK